MSKRKNCLVDLDAVKKEFDEKEWVSEWFSKYALNKNTKTVHFGNTIIVIDNNCKTSKVKCDDAVKGVAIAYAKYCGENIPEELLQNR